MKEFKEVRIEKINTGYYCLEIRESLDSEWQEVTKSENAAYVLAYMDCLLDDYRYWGFVGN